MTAPGQTAVGDRPARSRLLTKLDGAIIIAYLAIALGFGAWHARRASETTEEFFAADRSLPWWLAGTSIVATTFAADTPLAIAGLVATDGIAGNWFWWADVLPVVIGAFIVSHLWRRRGDAPRKHWPRSWRLERRRGPALVRRAGGEHNRFRLDG
jgi:hypothetical protein